MRYAGLLVVLAACGTSPPRQAGAPASATQTHVPPDTARVDTMPPVARAGMLVTHAVTGGGGVDWRWKPRAGRCASPPSLQLLAQGDSVDLLLLVDLPADSVAPRTYAVAPPTDTTPQAPAARLGGQRLLHTDLSFQAESGAVRLERLDEVATGRFDVTIHEMPSRRTYRYLGAFQQIPVDTLSQALCRFAEPDSTHAPAAIPRKPA